MLLSSSLLLLIIIIMMVIMIIIIIIKSMTFHAFCILKDRWVMGDFVDIVRNQA